jgi:hypothetical protein
LPATAFNSQLTLLGLRDNCLATLSDALPAADVLQNLRVLDISGNPLGRAPNARATQWTAENTAAISGNWPNLHVLGILGSLSHRPRVRLEVTDGLLFTAKLLQRLLRRQAAVAQPPRPPPVVVFSEQQEALLRPADELAVVT